ncbi:MAG: HU family DNA-binding protein [Planctomycetota bacterium]
MAVKGCIKVGTTTKKQLVDRIAQATGHKQIEVREIVQQFLDGIIEELSEGNRLEFRDFGVFEVRARRARIAQNPKTLERVPVPAKSTVKFKPGRRMREIMDGELPAPSANSAVTVEAKPAKATEAVAD